MKLVRKNKKGFTLVEVIVVLVILAIIIALAVPSVLKYIDDANDAKYLAQARAAYIAADVEITKDYAPDNTINDLGTNLTKKVQDAVGADVKIKNVKACTDKGGATEITSTTKPNEILSYEITITAGTVDKVVLITRNGDAKVK